VKANYNFDRVLTDSFDAPYFGSAPGWAKILGRETTTHRPDRIAGVAGRRVLVTGAGGFIGSEMARLFAASGAERVVLLDIAEQALFDLDRTMAARGFGGRSVAVLGSVCDRALLSAVFEEHRPEMVLHAAALKHVPLMERNPFAAVETNALGTWRLAQIAARHGLRKMILVSTDKAVAPHSIMGASKRIAELAMLAHTEFAAVRLVNVIGSPGSVAPLFAEQIAQGGPVTVTHPRAQRYFFTLDEVVALLAQAVESEAARGVLVPEPGEAIYIADLAQRMIKASGKGVPMVSSALRPGDKLEEALVTPRERCAGYVTAGLRSVVGPAATDLDARIAALEAAIAARDLSLLLRQVERLVPDYEPSVLLRDAVCASR
jgi:FlaA1/EpsC-like NDP-sugar epimerase